MLPFARKNPESPQNQDALGNQATATAAAVNEEAVPNLDTEAELLLWADRIVQGEPRRIANSGEPPCPCPPPPKWKPPLINEQAGVAALSAEADRVIRDIWNHWMTESFLHNPFMSYS